MITAIQGGPNYLLACSTDLELLTSTVKTREHWGQSPSVLASMYPCVVEQSEMLRGLDKKRTARVLLRQGREWEKGRENERWTGNDKT